VQAADSSSPSNTASKEFELNIIAPECPTVTPTSHKAAQPADLCGDIPLPDIMGVFPNQAPAGVTGLSVTTYGCYAGWGAYPGPMTLNLSLPGANVTSQNVVFPTDPGTAVQVAGTLNIPSTVTGQGLISVTQNDDGCIMQTNSVPFYVVPEPEVTVIAWVDGKAPDLVTFPSGANSALMNNLNGSTTACAFELFEWSVLQVRADINTSADVAYANAWLVGHSANAAPPSLITPSVQRSAGNYRLFNDFGKGSVSPNVGSTPDPCNTGLVPNMVLAGQASPYMGASGTSPSGEVYQLAEGRIGTLGQSGSETINGRTVPWIWSVIEFDSSGKPTTSNHAMFPTYSVYTNGALTNTYPQCSVQSFVANDETYQLIPSQIP